MLDDALVQEFEFNDEPSLNSLNPCYAGRCSSTTNQTTNIRLAFGLNPCYAGRCSSTRETETILIINMLQNYTKVIFAFLNQKLTVS